jgi:3-oxoacyl-[acyl-carrier-protein] synthase II
MHFVRRCDRSRRGNDQERCGGYRPGGGADAPICPSVLAGFDRLAMMPRSFNSKPEAAARPFSKDREGMVLGEGAAVLVLEEEQHASRRRADAIVEMAGYGATCDAYSHFRQEESGRDAVASISQALKMANVSPAEVDYVNAHGTGTRENDPFEVRVLRSALGPDSERVPISSSKSQFGHLLGAAAAVEAAAVIIGIAEQFVPPTLNLDEPDGDCVANHVVGRSRPCPLRVGVSTSFGFGSRNAALVFRRIVEV